MANKWLDTLQTGLGSSYHIRQELGGGGMSATFIAEEIALHRSVVIKVLAPELASGLSAERFEREIHLAARLQHAFIVPLLSAGITDGVPWYTMPLVQGESLRARLAREGALPPSAAARILRDVAEALAYAHAQGVIHRDIKPDNILLSGAHALVTDFGVAKAITASTTEGTATRTGLAVGTPAYMAPEQAAGDPGGDHRIDLYALGATAYEMVTGRQLFAQRAAAQLLVAHAMEQPEPLARAAADVPPELAALIEQLLAKHPNDRPSRAQDVADALSAMLTRWTSGDLPPVRGHVTLGQALALWLATFLGTAGAAWVGVRWLPIPEWTLPAVVLLLLAGLPVMLLSVWLHRPARPVTVVPSASSSTTVGRLEAIVRPHITWRRTTRAGAVTLGALALVAATWAGARTLGIGPAATLLATGHIAAEDYVFLADFDSPAADTGLGVLVSDLLRTELSRSASIRLLPIRRRSVVLTTMGRPESSRIGSTDAREFSQRANVKVFLSGSVTQLGSGYLLRSGLFETSTGNELASFRETAASADDIIRAVDRLGRDVRDKLGASLREVRTAPALYWTVTPSLEAARLYSEGLRLARAGDRAAAVRLLERAVQIDTAFAMAYRSMSAYYGDMGNPVRSSWAAERAYRHRHKLPGSIQRLVEGTYYYSPDSFDLDRSITTYEAAIEEFGPISVAHNNAAVGYTRKRDFDRAIGHYRAGSKFDTTSMFAPFTILLPLWASGRVEETERHLRETLPRWTPGNPNLPLWNALYSAARFQFDSAERVFERALRDTGMTAGMRSDRERYLAQVRRTQGRLRLAIAGFERAIALNRLADTARIVPLSALARAEIELLDREDPSAALHLLDSVTAAHPPGAAGALAYPWLELAALYARAGGLSRARTYLARFEESASDNAKRYFGHELEMARGWVALAASRHGDAVAAFRAADVGLCLTCSLAPLAIAYDLAGQPDSAITVFERYLSTRDLNRIDVDQRYLARVYRRLGELYDARGDTARAAEYHGRFVDLWHNADPELQPQVRHARRRLAALRPD